jgi:hypothetical protein
MRKRALLAIAGVAFVLGLAASTQIDLTKQVVGTLPHGNGGTDVTSPGSSGNVLTSNGSSWTSAAPAGGSGSGLPTFFGSSGKRTEFMTRSGNSSEKDTNGVDSSNSPNWNAATTTTPGNIVNYSGGYVEGQLQWLTGKNIHWQEYGLIQSTSSSISVTMGMSDTNTNSGNGSATPSGKYAMFRYIHGTDTNWQCMTSDGSSQTLTNSSTAVDTNAHTWDIKFNDSTPNVVFSIDGSTVCTLTTHLPGNGVVMRRGWYVGTGGSNGTAFAEWAFYVESDISWP